ncbi:MAG TPA: phosphoglycolate phosphatase [Rudaea sp.]|jgi:phosphoglycolate phosphatase|uniref:phosphoglycolate phosphatase n=1 Tax=Rudaea sp. TaxID=2136325 RepID=UPI002F92F158
MRLRGAEIEAVFFDLDGTLVDSAADLIAAMNRLRAELGEAPVDSTAVGQVVSKGGRAMLRRGFLGADEARIEALLPRFLQLYSEGIAVHTRPYPGIDAVLSDLERLGIRWGIVTNKPGHLARAVVAELKLDSRSDALVSGDCLAQRKPDPAQLLHACALVGVTATRSVYVGDDARDIEAGQRAGMMTVAAAWGYLDGENPQDWGADRVVAMPHELLAALGLD